MFPSVSGRPVRPGKNQLTQIDLRRTADELGVVVGEPDPQRLGDGHLPILAAFGVADLQHSGVDVDIAGTQQAGLAERAGRRRRSCGTAPA